METGSSRGSCGVGVTGTRCAVRDFEMSRGKRLVCRGG